MINATPSAPASSKPESRNEIPSEALYLIDEAGQKIWNRSGADIHVGGNPPGEAAHFKFEQEPLQETLELI